MSLFVASHRTVLLRISSLRRMNSARAFVGFAVLACILVQICSAGNTVEITRMGLFKVAVLRSQKPVVVYFTKSSCSQCKQILKDLENVANRNSGKMTLATVDFDKYPDLRKEFEVTTVPTTRTFYRGQLLRQVEGPLSGAVIAITNNALKTGEKKPTK